MVTERDILYQLIADGRSPFKTTLKEITSSPVITVEETTTVENAIRRVRS